MNSNSKKKRAILVVDQDFRYQLLNQLTLQSQYDVVVVGTIADAVALRPLSRFELFIFGVEASGPNSLEACEQAQRLPEVKDIPVILTTENPGDFAGRFSFDLHEEHLLKPYDPFELSARVRSRVGKSKSENLEEILRSGGLELNLTQRRVFWTREKPCEIFLTAIEFKILQLFIENPRRALSREEIVAHTWGTTNILRRTVDTHVCNIRTKIPESTIKISAVHAVGYRYTTDEESVSWLRPAA